MNSKFEKKTMIAILVVAILVEIAVIVYAAMCFNWKGYDSTLCATVIVSTIAFMSVFVVCLTILIIQNLKSERAAKQAQSQMVQSILACANKNISTKLSNNNTVTITFNHTIKNQAQSHKTDITIN